MDASNNASVSRALSVAAVPKWDETTDVLIIGYGAAGACAALEAARAGARVCILEAAASCGGASALSSGEIYVGGGGGTSIQRAAGFDDSTEDMYRYLMMAGGPDADEAKVRLYVDRSLDHFDWMVKQGISFKNSYIPERILEPETDDCLVWSGSEDAWPFSAQAKPCPRGFMPQWPGGGTGRQMMDVLAARVAELSIEVHYDTRCVSLVMDETGRIRGVVSRHAGQHVFVEAKRGVILCAGGFIMNRELVRQHALLGLSANRPIGTIDDGSGILLGQSVGGHAIHMDEVFVTLPQYPPEQNIQGIFIDQRGQRFINEDCYHGRVTQYLLRRAGTRFWLLLDGATFVEQPLYRTLPTTRLSFGGDKLELRLGDKLRYAALVDIKEYADAVEPGVLNELLYERSEFIETQSFSILPRREAIRALELQRDQLIASDDVVASQVAEMDVALNDLGDGQFCMGEYHYSLVVFGDDVSDAGRRAAQAIGAVAESSSLQMSPVDLVADAAWFAQMPGNWRWRPREAKLSSRAFAALASSHNFARGKRDGNPWGEALALLRTPSGQPFYLNLHSSPEGEDSGDKKLPGNTLIVGSTGVGKTTLEMFLLAMTRKWNPAPRLVLFDLYRGCEIALRALGGLYFTLEAGKPTHLNPLQREPTPARLQFWEQLIRTCIGTAALPLLPADEHAIADAVKAVAMLPAALRRFSTVRQNLPKTGENRSEEHTSELQ